MARSWQKDAQVARFLSQAPSLGERCRCTWSLKALNAILFPSNFSRICMHFSKTNSYLAAVSLVQGLRDSGWGAFSGLGTVSLVVPSCSTNKCNLDKWNGAFSSALRAWNPHIDLKNGKIRIDFMSTYESTIWTSDHNQKPANRAPRVWITLFHASQHRHVPAAVSAWNAKLAWSNQVLVQIYVMYHCQSPYSISRIMKIIFCLFEVLVQVKTSLTAQEVPTGEEEEEKKSEMIDILCSRDWRMRLPVHWFF